MQHVGFSLQASLVVGHRLKGAQASVTGSLGSRAQASSYGAGVLLFCGMWDLPRSGIKPLFPALAGRFFTTEPPGKPLSP